MYKENKRKSKRDEFVYYRKIKISLCAVIAYITITTYKDMHSGYDRYDSTEVMKRLIIYRVCICKRRILVIHPKGQ